MKIENVLTWLTIEDEPFSFISISEIYFILYAERCAFIFIGNTNIQAYLETSYSQRYKTENKMCGCIFAFATSSFVPCLLSTFFFLLNIDSYSIRNAIRIKFPLPVFLEARNINTLGNRPNKFSHTVTSLVVISRVSIFFKEVHCLWKMLWFRWNRKE